MLNSFVQNTDICLLKKVPRDFVLSGVFQTIMYHSKIPCYHFETGCIILKVG